MTYAETAKKEALRLTALRRNADHILVTARITGAPCWMPQLLAALAADFLRSRHNEKGEPCPQFSGRC